MQETKVAELLFQELKRADRMYGTGFNSPHEGYALMLEEMDELWEEIRKKVPDKEKLREEAIQIGAMAMKFIISLEDRNCKTCQYNVITKGELIKLESDPCETCDCNLRNWKLREP